MKIDKYRIELIFIILFIVISLIENINAANIGISPAEISFKQVLRGGYSERNVFISVDSVKPITVEIQPRGDVAGWMNFSSINFSLFKDKPYSLKVMINPPRDIPNGNYTGFLRFFTSSFGEGTPGHAVGLIRSSLDLVVNVEIIDREILSCSVNKVDVSSVEKGDDIVFTMNFQNNGNIRLKPNINIKIWDIDQKSVVKSQDFLEKEILPSTEGKLDLRIKSNDLDISQYWAELTAPDCYYNGVVTFDVLQPGALKADGSILGIMVKKSYNIGETSPILVLFKNTGEKEVEAQFRGQINLGENVVQILESEKINVPVSDTYQFNFFFTPKETGRHVISGRVYYSSKKTFELSASFDVISSKKLNLRNFIFYGIYIVLITLILILFFKIRKERRSYLGKLKRLK